MLVNADSNIKPTRKNDDKSSSRAKRRQADDQISDQKTGKPNEFGFRLGLGIYAHQETVRFFTSYMGNKPHLQLRALFTDK